MGEIEGPGDGGHKTKNDQVTSGEQGKTLQVMIMGFRGNCLSVHHYMRAEASRPLYRSMLGASV